jgi:hypothetical protein
MMDELKAERHRREKNGFTTASQVANISCSTLQQTLTA